MRAPVATGTWTSDAACAGHRHLPWTDEMAPGIADLRRMAAVCEQCPVIGQCANYALRGNDGRGVGGGFYAGVWLPWSYYGEQKHLRATARRQLRRTAVS